MQILREVSLPSAIYTAAQARAIDAYAIERLKVSGSELMARAGEAALRVLLERWPLVSSASVVCGSGNNAGDGYVLARLAAQRGIAVTCVALAAPEQLHGDAASAWRAYVDAGGRTVQWSDAALSSDVLVDAIFGIGLNRAVSDQMASVVVKMNDSGKPILALDLPSGVHADTGAILGVAIRARCTVTFLGLKLGCFVGAGPECTGELFYDSLGLHIDEVPARPIAQRLGTDWLRTVLPRRERTTHKGDNGHVLAIGGAPGMAGAVRLTAEAALRVGAGLVTVATAAENVSSIVGARPELMVRGVVAADLAPLFERATVVAVGPGLGLDTWGRELFAAAFESGKPLVVDADALNLLARTPQRRSHWVLTPHPGEAARLLESDSRTIQGDRLANAQRLAQRFGAIAVLKGACTWVTRENDLPAVCTAGNPGMATAGMGDVLTGAIAGIAAQTNDLWDAARAGVLMHSMAGDAASMDGERGVIAGDLFPFLRAAANPHV